MEFSVRKKGGKMACFHSKEQDKLFKHPKTLQIVLNLNNIYATTNLETFIYDL